jgi:hypothetical protein
MRYVWCGLLAWISALNFWPTVPLKLELFQKVCLKNITQMQSHLISSYFLVQYHFAPHYPFDGCFLLITLYKYPVCVEHIDFNLSSLSHLLMVMWRSSNPINQVECFKNIIDLYKISQTSCIKNL